MGNTRVHEILSCVRILLGRRLTESDMSEDRHGGQRERGTHGAATHQNTFHTSTLQGHKTGNTRCGERHIRIQLQIQHTRASEKGIDLYPDRKGLTHRI